MTLSVIIVDDHHHCLSDIHLAIRRRFVPFSNIHVVHVDAHPDLSFPSVADTSAIFTPETLYELLDNSVAGIAEFLLPLVFAGHVNQITWLKPWWATQIPTGRFQQLAVGKRTINGTMGVTSELFHFVENELFCPLEDLNMSSIRYFDLFTTETISSTNATNVAAEAIATARQNSKSYILDIDLDYFSTWNPFRKDLEARIGESKVTKVVKVFSSVRFMQNSRQHVTGKQRNEEKKTFDELMNRLKAVDTREDATIRRSEWLHLQKDFIVLYDDTVEVDKMLDDFYQVLETYREDEATRREIWTNGSFLTLPHHESSQKEIERMILELEQFLHTHKLDHTNPPVLITIAKSVGDEYLPPYQVKETLSSVLQMLERLYGHFEPNFVEYESVHDMEN
ncbi:hypothetical protein PsorP6_018211 [Peronosclerospora sorghi]|uniref:Uncharacterized protein n=1 Tax=Peronosclerospora sorghi TaxID=230839 RepID=A0ACC0WBB5_9STRA|nr:hypothetical protein PsorP6_018211 [Peronosclerospora sorghi]